MVIKQNASNQHGLGICRKTCPVLNNHLRSVGTFRDLWEILYLRCIKPCKWWDKLPTSTGSLDFFHLPPLRHDPFSSIHVTGEWLVGSGSNMFGKCSIYIYTYIRRNLYIYIYIYMSYIIYTYTYYMKMYIDTYTYIRLEANLFVSEHK